MLERQNLQEEHKRQKTETLYIVVDLIYTYHRNMKPIGHICRKKRCHVKTAARNSRRQLAMWDLHDDELIRYTDVAVHSQKLWDWQMTERECETGLDGSPLTGPWVEN